jgi:hypothetical protein
MTLLVRKGSPGGLREPPSGRQAGKRLMRREQLMHAATGADRRSTDADAGRDLRDVAQGLGMTCVVDDRRAGRHHHRRRPATHMMTAGTNSSTHAAR